MITCKTCNGELTVEKPTIEGMYYECTYCGDLTHESEVNYKSSNIYKPNIKPPCQVNGHDCDSMGKCKRNKCIDYMEYTKLYSEYKEQKDRLQGRKNDLYEFKSEVVRKEKRR